MGDAVGLEEGPVLETLDVQATGRHIRGDRSHAPAPWVGRRGHGVGRATGPYLFEQTCSEICVPGLWRNISWCGFRGVDFVFLVGLLRDISSCVWDWCVPGTALRE